MLESAQIPCYLNGEYAYKSDRGRLMVPVSYAEQARELLASIRELANSPISDEDLDAQAEAAGEPDPKPE